MNYKLIVLAVMVLVFLYGLFLKALRARSVNNPIPDNVKDVYDAESYAAWRRYHGEKGRLDIISGFIAFAVDMVLMIFNLYARFAGLFSAGDMAQAFAVLLLSALSALVTLPADWYETMVIEEKYGFNRSTKKTFILDQVKSFVIGLGLMSGIAYLLMVLDRALGDYLILAFALAMTALMLLFAFLFPFFSRIFNKFTPLEDGELKEKLMALLQKHGYKVRAIQVMDASRRTTKSNAYFTGFGKMKTIVLYDTLVQAMTTEEICAVFAHEMGHGLHRDTLKNQILTFVQMLVIGVLAFFTLRTPALFQAFGFDKVNYGFALILIMSVEFALISPLFSLLAAHVSRRAEYRADAQAVAEGYGEALISGLKKLSRENFADLAPDPLLVRLEYSHPTLSQRIDAIEHLQKQES